MSRSPSKILFIPDVHIPFEDKRAFSLMVRTASKVGFDHLYILGDFADFAEVSFHERAFGKRPVFASEVRSVNKQLDRLDALNIPHKNFVEGNHEYRYGRYLAERAPALEGLPGTTVPELFRLKERGWKYTPYKHETRIGKLWITHDEGTAGPLAAMRARSTYEGNVVIGHCHAMSVLYQGNARGESHVGASFGWLGNRRRVDYLHQVKARRWQLGFGVGVMEPNGVVHLQAVPIINYKCCVFGEVYS